MTQIITNYTTYDQAYYYADLKRLPRVSEQERRHMLASMQTTHDPCLNAQIKQQLIESYLPLAKYFAIALCPKSRYQRDLPDLIGEANLTVVEVITRADLTRIDDLTSYLVAWLRGKLKGAISDDGLVKIGHEARLRAKERGEADPVNALDHLLSLDEQMEWFDTDDLEEPRATPIMPAEAAPPRDPQQRVQVEALLSYLSPRAQAILRLRYGLSDDNEHRHTTAEMVRLLGLDRRLILTTERDALRRLKALVAGEATLITRQGKQCISYTRAYRSPVLATLPPAQEETLMQAYRRLRERDVTVTIRALVQEAGFPRHLVQAFLRLHREESPKETRARQRQARLFEVCARLEAQGVRVTGPRLSKEARVMKGTALAYLRAYRQGGESHARA